MRIIRRFLFIGLSMLLLAGFSFGQETETKVIDEVVAQVNDGVITLSRIRREKQNIIDSYKQEGKSPEEAARLVEGRQGELIAQLINEELLVQKAKELGIDSEIDATINARFVEIMKQNNVKTLEALYQMMQSQGVDPQELRETWRKQAIREKVIQREVQSKIYWLASGRELKDYFEKNKSKFNKPENVSISEIYLGFAGRQEATVREKAKAIYDELKKGGDFARIAKENSDPGIITEGAGSAEKLPISTLVEKVAGPLRGVKVGDYTLPFEIEQMGMIILRVDAREAASSESFFDESAVRLAILNEKFPEEQKKFMASLRELAYIKINDTYRPIVAPILYADERKDKPAK